MAKRSDFAQKLLDDLRLRKERMGLAQATQRPEPRAKDTHENSRWSFRGSGEAIGKKFNSKPMIGADNTRKTQSARNFTAPIAEAASKEIIPVARSGRPKHTTDMSRELTIAFRYGGKNLNWDLYSNSTNKGFILQQTSVNFRGREDRQQHSYISQIHIEEISKCAEKLNKILKACSNGIKLDRNSIEIGRELLRGAIDLEESLGMLASLQEASEYMVNPQRKQVRLLKEKEEDQASTAKAKQQMIVRRPRLSLNGIQSTLEDGREQEQATFFYTGKQTKPKSSKCTNDSMKMIYHSRSASCGPSLKPETPSSAIRNHSNSEEVRASSVSKAPTDTASSHNISSHTNYTRQPASHISSGHEKLRIPNVIAKLMGLEDLPPPKTESENNRIHKVIQSTQGTRTATNLRAIDEEINEEVHMATLTENSALKKEVRRKVLQEKESAMAWATKNFEVMKSKGKTNLKILKTASVSPVTKDSDKVLSKPERSDVDGKSKKLLEKELRTTNETGYKGKQNEKNAAKETQDLSFDLHNTLPKPFTHPHNEQINQDFPGRVRNAQTYAKGFSMQVYPLKHENDGRPMEPNVVQQSESKSKTTKKGQSTNKELESTNVIKSAPKRTKNTKSIHEIRSEKLISKTTGNTVNKRSSTYAIDKKQVKDPLRSSHLENITIRSTTPIEHQVDMKSQNANKWGRPLRVDSKFKKENVKSLVSSCKSLPPTRTQWNAKTGNVQEELKETTGSQSQNASDELHAQHIYIFQENTQEKASNDRAGEEIMSLDPTKLEQCLQEKAQTTSNDNPVMGDSMMPKEKFEATPTDTDSHETIIHAAHVRQPSENSMREDQETQFLDATMNPAPGSTDGMQWHISNCNSLKQNDQAVSNFDRKELLTDDEKHLRKILANSQLFLSNAQTLFNIKIPVSLIPEGKTECQDEQRKIALDSGFEVMRRKGRRQEISLLSTKEVSTATVRVRCMDDLIKELNNDLKSLEFSVLNEDCVDTSEFLHKMLERDIHDSNPDVNCMWDFSWKSLKFVSAEKNEVAKDMEKHVLNGLINDIVKDILNVSISA
uniref:DUF3741 domain-containing protein n=1 Tax=Anthurium amnicola TaxID=1678845 RepID=A0A1D1Y332_9ARAE